MGHHHKQSKKQKQFQFEKTHWKHRYTHGGVLRKKRSGRKARPLSSKDPVHLVFKVEKRNLKRGLRSALAFKIIRTVTDTYAKRFFLKIEQQVICVDHIHLLIRLPRRAQGQAFFRVVAGQIAQHFKANGLLAVTDTQNNQQKIAKLWKYRPFTRVVVGYKAYRIVRDYIQLNLKEAEGLITYSKNRLKGLSSAEWELLWS